MKKVTIIINNLGAGGAERYVVDSINEMIRRGIEIRLITFKSEKNISFASECNIDKSNWIMVPVASVFSIKSLYKLSLVIREQNPELVITHLWYANIMGRLASKLAGVTNIFSMEHSMHFSKSWKQRLADWGLQVFSDRIIAVSEAVKKSLIDGGISASKISVVYVALNTKRFGQSTTASRADFGIPEGEFIFLYTGRLNPPKNVLTIIQSFNDLGKGVLCIAGSGESEQALKALTTSLGNSDILFLGFVKNIPSLMSVCDCFVFVPLWEALGLVGVEALLSNLPVITTANSAMSEFVTDGYNGLLIDHPQNIVALSHHMETMMNNKELYEKLKRNAKNLKIDFSIEHNIDELLQLIVKS